MTTRLSLYNGALLECGERELASLSENVQARRLLDNAWDRGAVNYCLNQGDWVFAARTQQLAAETSITSEFGYRNAFTVPTDCVRKIVLCSDGYLTTPLLQYVHEQRYFWSDLDTIYFKYVSNDAAYGGDLTLWPQDFVDYFQTYLASRIIKKLNQSAEDVKDIFALARKRLNDCIASNSTKQPTLFPPLGRLASARLGNQARRSSFDGVIPQ